MPHLKIFISSPGDVPNERLRADLVVDKLAQEYGRFFTLEVYRWEHEPMLASGHFQDAIEPPSTCDIVVLIVWSRLGTLLPPKTQVREYKGIDGRVPVTGTEWEYEDALAAARARGTPDILAFRNIGPAPVDTRDPEARAKSLAQLDALDSFWRRHFADKGVFLTAYEDYRDLEGFARRLEESLRKLIERRIEALEPNAGQGAIWPGPPFRGLESYEFEHAPIFFGRDGFVAQAAEQFAARARSGTAFLLVSGASGSGKSSLVKAALVPRLMKPQRIEKTAFLRRALFRPADGRNDIIRGLVDKLIGGPAENGVGLPELLAPGQTAADLAAYLRSTADAPGFVFGGALGRLTEEGRKAGRLLPYEEGKLILVIDQLEELFTIEGITGGDRRLFTRLLGGLARSGTVWVVATMRSDFWHRVADVPELMGLADGPGRLEVPRPSPVELADMIRKPAQAAGLSFEVRREKGLDAVLAEQAASEPGALPLLSFTLDAIYAEDVVKKGGRILTYATYEELGGLEGAIATRADQIVTALPQQAQDALARVLRALTTISGAATQTPVARTVPLNTFAPGSQARALVDALTEARLLVASGEGTTPTVRLAHEALLSAWQRAKDQLSKDRRDLETRALVERQHARWDMVDAGDKRGLLLRDPDLASAVDLARRWRDELAPELRSFVVRSQNAAKAAARLRWILAAAVMICLALLSSASIGALAVAEVQRNDALVAQSLSLARDARSAITAGDPTLGMLLSLNALPRNLARPDRPFVIDAEYPLADAFANRRERAVLRGHLGNVNSVAFSPDGKEIVTASEDMTARIWDARTGAPIKILRGHTRTIHSAFFSPDGTHILTASDDGDARLWDVRTGAAKRLTGHAGPVTFALFSPDGSKIVTASDDGTAWIWDGKTAEPGGKPLKGQHGRLLALAFSPDNRHVAIGYDDGVAVLWDTQTGGTTSLKGHTDSVTSVAFSRDGSRVVTGSEDATARVWMVATGAGVAVLKGHAAEIHSVVFSPDGKQVLTASADWTARIWDAATGAQENVLNGHTGEVYCANFSPSGGTVVTASDDKTVRLWDPRQTGPAVAVLGGFGGLVFSAVFSPDGKSLATAAQEQVARVWNVEPAAALAVLGGHTDAVTDVAYAPGGTLLATASTDATARLWDARKGALLYILSGHAGAVNAVAFSPDGTLLATASDDRTARLWNARTGALVATLNGHKGAVKDAAFSPDGRLIVTASADHSARLWDGRTGASRGVLQGHDGGIAAAAFSPDGREIATASFDETARLWDVQSEKTVAVLHHSGAVDWAAFSPDGTRVVTASYDGTARLWDAKSGAPLAVMQHGKTVVSSAAFSPDGKLIVTAAWDHMARLWDGKTGALLHVLRGHKNSVWSARFSPDGRRVVTASEDETSDVWDVATGAVIASFNGHEGAVRAATFSPDGRRIATASRDTTARLWKMPPLCQALIEASRKELPRDLSSAERARYFLEQRRPGMLSRIYEAIAPLLALVRPAAAQSCE